MNQSEAILTAYQFQCVVCNGPANVVHHAYPRSKYPEYRDDPENLIPLCVPCHARIHEAGAVQQAALLKDKARILFRALNPTQSLQAIVTSLTLG